MTNSVALVTVDMVVAEIREHVVFDKGVMKHRAAKRGVSVDMVKEEALTTIAKKALAYTENHVAQASQALVIVKGQANRLKRCTELLLEFDSEVVSAAYELKEDLSESCVSLTKLCHFLKHTDCDAEGEITILHSLLDEVARHAPTPQHEGAMHTIILDMLEDGHMMEAIEDHILNELKSRANEGEWEDE